MTRLRPKGRDCGAPCAPPPRYSHLAAPDRWDRRLRARALRRAPAEHRLLRRRRRSRAPRRGACARSRRPHPRRLTETYLRFLERAIDPSGLAHNRMAVDGDWTDEPALGDWWGRALWATGVASIQAADPSMRRDACTRSSIVPRGTVPTALHTAAFAALGRAGAARRSDRRTQRAGSSSGFVAIAARRPGPAWPWPEDRLRYGNGSVAEATIAVRPRVAGPGDRRAGPVDAVVPPRDGDALGSSLGHRHRRPGPDRDGGAVRPATDRGRSDRPTRASPRSRRQRTPPGSTASNWHGHGSRATTTAASP